MVPFKEKKNELDMVKSLDFTVFNDTDIRKY